MIGGRHAVAIAWVEAQALDVLAGRKTSEQALDIMMERYPKGVRGDFAHELDLTMRAPPTNELLRGIKEVRCSSQASHWLP